MEFWTQPGSSPNGLTSICGYLMLDLPSGEEGYLLPDQSAKHIHTSPKKYIEYKNFMIMLRSSLKKVTVIKGVYIFLKQYRV